MKEELNKDQIKKLIIDADFQWERRFDKCDVCQDIINNLDEKIKAILENALENYVILIGLCDNDFINNDLLNEQRENYKSFIEERHINDNPDNPKIKVFDIINCANFMATEYQIPFPLAVLYAVQSDY